MIIILMLKKRIMMHGSCMRGFSEDRSSFRSLTGEHSKVRTGLKSMFDWWSSEQLDHQQRKWSRFGAVTIINNHQSSSPMSSESSKLLKSRVCVIDGASEELDQCARWGPISNIFTSLVIRIFTSLVIRIIFTSLVIIETIARC